MPFEIVDAVDGMGHLDEMEVSGKFVCQNLRRLLWQVHCTRWKRLMYVKSLLQVSDAFLVQSNRHNFVIFTLLFKFVEGKLAQF